MKVFDFYQKLNNQKEESDRLAKSLGKATFNEVVLAVALHSDWLEDHIQSLKFLIHDKQKQIDILKEEIRNLKGNR